MHWGRGSSQNDDFISYWPFVSSEASVHAPCAEIVPPWHVASVEGHDTLEEKCLSYFSVVMKGHHDQGHL